MEALLESEEKEREQILERIFRSNVVPQVTANVANQRHYQMGMQIEEDVIQHAYLTICKIRMEKLRELDTNPAYLMNYVGRIVKTVGFSSIKPGTGFSVARQILEMSTLKNNLSLSPTETNDDEDVEERDALFETLVNEEEPVDKYIEMWERVSVQLDGDEHEYLQFYLALKKKHQEIIPDKYQRLFKRLKEKIKCLALNEPMPRWFRKPDRFKVWKSWIAK